MIRVGHFADTHLGYRQYGLSEREIDFYEQFTKVIEDMIEQKVDLVIHSGDLFEQAKPPIKALLTAKEGFEKLSDNNIPVYVIAGNHDKLQRTETSIPQELYENENFHIISFDKPAVYHDELFLGGMSFINIDNQDAIKDILTRIKEEAIGYKYKILALHGGTEKNFKINPEFKNETIPYGFDYYAMGHIHNRIDDTFHDAKLCYPGSTELRSANEVENYEKKGKGYNIVTFDDEAEKIVSVEEVKVPLKRRFIIETIKYPRLDEELERLYKEIKLLDEKPILLLTVKDGNFSRSEVIKQVHDKLKKHSLTIKLKYQPSQTTDGENIPEKMQSVEEAIKNKTNEKYDDETINTLALNLYKELYIPNLEEALRISDEYFRKRYNTGDITDDNQ